MSAPNQLSFLPDDYLERKAQRRTNAICAALFLIVVAGIGAAFTISERANRAVDKQWAEELEKYTSEAKKIDQVRQMQERQKKMAHQAELTASLLEKVPRSYLLAEFTNALPPGVSLTDLTLDSRLRQPPAAPVVKPKTIFEEKKAELEAKAKGPPPVKAKEYDVLLKVTGIAHTDVQVAQFIRKLSMSPLLQDVNLVIVDDAKMDDDKVRKFQLEMALNPTAVADPLHAPSMTKTAAVEVSEK